MHTANDLRFSMAVHLLRTSNPSKRQSVRRAPGHRNALGRASTPTTDSNVLVKSR